MNIERKIENIFEDIRDSQLRTDYNCYVLLDISEPIMFTISKLNQYYLVYIMQNKSILLKDNTKTDVIEILIVETTMLKIKKLLEGEEDIKNSFDIEEFKPVYRIGKIGNKIFPKKLVNNIKEIENKIPMKNVFFDNKLPNKVNVKQTLHSIESDYKNYNYFFISDNTKMKEKIIKFVNGAESEINKFNENQYNTKMLVKKLGEKNGSTYS